MEDTVVVPATGLSEIERVVDVFVAPSKTFADILRNGSWWLPFCFMIVVGLCFTTAIDKKVGFEAVAQQQMEASPMMADRFAAMSPADRAQVLQRQTKSTRISAYFFSIFILIWGLIVALLYWASMNFMLGAQLKYKQVLAAWVYGSLPATIKTILAAGLLFANVGTENFNIKNPVGTNPPYYLPDLGGAVKAALGFFDFFGLWSVILMVIALSVMSGKSKQQTAYVVFGWWTLGLLLSMAIGAIFG